MKIQPEWIDWAKQQIRILKDGGYMAFPCGAVFQIHKKSKTVQTLCEAPSYFGSDTQKINVEVFGIIGYKVVRNNPPTDFDTFINQMDKIFKSGGTFLTQDLVSGVAGVFEVKPEDVMTKMKKQINGNVEPVNPITLRGSNNLSIGRLWLESNEISSGQHVFAPGKKRENQEKTMQFVFWVQPEKPLTYMIISDENVFIEGIWKLQNNPQGSFGISGVRAKGNSTPCSISFVRAYDKLTIALDDVSETYDWDHVYRGLKHLFPKAELINPLSN